MNTTLSKHIKLPEILDSYQDHTKQAYYPGDLLAHQVYRGTLDGFAEIHVSPVSML